MPEQKVVVCGYTGNNEHMRYLRECLQREDSTGLWEKCTFGYRRTRKSQKRRLGRNQKGGSSTSNFY